PHVKGNALQRLMRRYQPEGGPAPVTFDDPRDQNAIRGVLGLGVPVANVTGKAKRWQNRKPDEIASIIERLWRRGASGDPRAISLLLDHHPEGARPALLRGPADTWLWPWLGTSDASDAAALLENQYWTRNVPRETLSEALL